MKGHGRRIVCIANPAPAIDAYQATPTIDGTQQLHYFKGAFPFQGNSS
jgi:hypothetical protein